MGMNDRTRILGASAAWKLMAEHFAKALRNVVRERRALQAVDEMNFIDLPAIEETGR